MRDAYEIRDPFTGETVQVSSALIDRLRGRYAVGPTMPDGEPEFGWRTHETPPIQHEAAKEIERLESLNAQLLAALQESVKEIRAYQSPECDDEGAPGAAELKAADIAITKATATGESK